MVRSVVISFCVLAGCASLVLPQQRVSPRNMYERLLCVVPIVGAGTEADPKRPMYVPAEPQPGQEPARNGILAFASLVSDDGHFALVEFVARDRSAFAAILADKRPDVKVFEKGKANRLDIEREFRRFKRDFNLEGFGVILP